MIGMWGRCRAGMIPIWGAVAAWLCRRYSEATLRDLAERLGLSRADSVPNLPRRLEASLKTAPRLASELDQIMTQVRARSAAALDTPAHGRRKHGGPSTT